ncbi:MAG: hypothetical protein K0Q64_1070 [Nitrobacter vulgaris]|nr:hypothetical protein [Nitrobacter vulgaris]
MMTPLRERYGQDVVDAAGNLGSVVKRDEPATYAYETEMVFVKLVEPVAGQQHYWYDEYQLKEIQEPEATAGR